MSEQSILLKLQNTLNRSQEEIYFLLSALGENPYLTQRDISRKLNISLGKTNYLLKSLIEKGLIKIKNFTHNPGKLKKVQYLLTQKGWQEKIFLTYHFLKKKEEEYRILKEEWGRAQKYIKNYRIVK